MHQHSRQGAQARIGFRAASLADATMLLAWRNAPVVRASSGDPHTITAKTHQTWMRAVLADPQRRLVVATLDGIDAGCVRFDCDSPQATVSIYLAPSALGKGLGAAIIDAACGALFEDRPDIHTIRAQVLPGNAASAKAFVRAGFSPTQQILCRQRSAPT